MARNHIDGGKDGSVCSKIVNIFFWRGKKISQVGVFLDALTFCDEWE